MARRSLCSAPNGNLDRQRGLSAAHSTETGHRPVQPQEFHQATDQPVGLLQGELEQHFQRQDSLDGCIRIDLRATRHTATALF